MPFHLAYDPIRALRSAWGLFTRAPFPLFVGGVLCWLLDGGSPLGALLRDHDHRIELREVLGLLGIGLCCSLIGLFVVTWSSLGLAHAVRETMEDRPAGFSALFETSGRYVEMLLVRVLLFVLHVLLLLPFGGVFLAAVLLRQSAHLHPAAVLLGAGCAALAYLPVYVYVALGLSLAIPAVAVEGARPTEALRRSWSLVRGNRPQLLVYWIALAVFVLLGLFLCCVGVVLTGALGQVTVYESYVRLVASEAPPTVAGSATT